MPAKAAADSMSDRSEGPPGFRGYHFYLLPIIVESRCGAVVEIRISLRFHTPLIELDRRISRIQLSDKASWIPLFHTFAHEPLPLPSLKLV